MFSQLTPFIGVVLAVLDYVVKAMVNYRNTDEGRAEWNDIEAALEQVSGDEVGEAEARARAATNRQNLSVNRQGQKPAGEFRISTED